MWFRFLNYIILQNRNPSNFKIARALIWIPKPDFDNYMNLCIPAGEMTPAGY